MFAFELVLVAIRFIAHKQNVQNTLGRKFITPQVLEINRQKMVGYGV